MIVYCFSFHPNNTVHPAGRSISSEWFVNSLVMVACEFSQTFVLKRFLTDNHCWTIYEPDRIERRSYRVQYN